MGRPLGWFLILLGAAYGAETARTAVSDIIYEKAFARALEDSQNEEMPTMQAIKDGKRALKFDPGNAQALIMLGTCTVTAPHGRRRWRAG